MSWSGFKKNVGRATTQVMMKTGQVEKTTDREYEVEERRYRTLESASLRLQKEAKGYLDSLRAMTASQMRIAETIDAFYGDSGARDGVSRSYKQAVEDLDAETVKALDGPYRCVPRSLRKSAEDDPCCTGKTTIEEVEKELNFKAGNRRNYTQGIIGSRDCNGFERACELMDYIYRTTVLEPINRFCAYFPDINECIKKRQHKMLDYDALRSRVKKLTEKPDKDPGKLPRTEKETEMVSAKSSFLHAPIYDSMRAHTSMSTRTSSSGSPAKHSDPDLDVSIPSPPKALQRPEIEKLRRAERLERSNSMNLKRSSSGSGRFSSLKSLGLALGAAPDEVMLMRSISAMAGSISPPDDGPTADRFKNLSHTPTRTPRNFFRSFTETPTPTPSISVPECDNNGDNKQQSRPGSRRNVTPTPFFQPSELEEIMQPFKEEFMQRQADILIQAKAAYEQLNDQLTQELPQLIDLRVPYLDPSFEALVKIQLRFCAEAYSRMAQVQQYLDASTRDQYASGDLDARVEDVLGQIRELSIAGTV